MGKLSRADEAVTAPLGTAITIGIVIALAVGLVIMLRIFMDTDQERSQPLTIIRDEDGDFLRMAHVEDGEVRSAYEVKMSVAGDMDFQIIQSGDDALAADVFTPLGGAPGGPDDAGLETGSILRLCATAEATNIKVQVRHIGSNTMIWDGDFLSLDACPP